MGDYLSSQIERLQIVASAVADLGLHGDLKTLLEAETADLQAALSEEAALHAALPIIGWIYQRALEECHAA